MNIWLTTDTHFNHDKMIEYCDRPKNFEELIRKYICSFVKSDDILIHLGDVCFGNDRENNNWFINKGFKRYLVKGNHDKKSNKFYLENGWDFVCDTFSDNFFGKNILFSHEPKPIGNFDFNIHGHFHNALPRLLRQEWKADGEKERNEQNLIDLTNDKHKLLALEYTDYRPVLLKTLLKENLSIIKTNK